MRASVAGIRGQTGPMEMVRFGIHQGVIEEAAESWLYVWTLTETTGVVYVGGTGLPPHLRTWLHLHSDDPDVARIAHRYPEALFTSFEVIAGRLPDELDRASSKEELIRHLHAQSLLDERYVGDPPVPGGGDERVVEAVRPLVEAIEGLHRR